MTQQSVCIFIAFLLLWSRQDFAIETSSKSQQDPCCHGEIRRWSHGCYTLVHDTEPLGAEFALDVLLYIGGKGESCTINKVVCNCNLFIIYRKLSALL